VAENVFARVMQDVTDFAVTPEEFVDGGETIACTGRYSGRGAKTGLSFDTPFVHLEIPQRKDRVLPHLHGHEGVGGRARGRSGVLGVR
jgi:hypothetical protein